MSNIFNEEIKEKKPRSEKQQANDKKLKDKFKSYHETKKNKADMLNTVIKEIEIESDTELMINKIKADVLNTVIKEIKIESNTKLMINKIKESVKRKYNKKLHPGVKNTEPQSC